MALLIQYLHVTLSVSVVSRLVDHITLRLIIYKLMRVNLYSTKTVTTKTSALSLMATLMLFFVDGGIK